MNSAVIEIYVDKKDSGKGLRTVKEVVKQEVVD